MKNRIPATSPREAGPGRVALARKKGSSGRAVLRCWVCHALLQHTVCPRRASTTRGLQSGPLQRANAMKLGLVTYRLGKD